MKYLYMKGEAVPQWLAQGPDVTFGCDVEVTDQDDGFLVRPRRRIVADECLMRGKDVPHFPKKVILWTEPSSHESTT